MRLIRSVVAYPEIQGCSLWDSISLCTLNRGSQVYRVDNIVFSPLYTHGGTWVEVATQLAPRCILTEVHGLHEVATHLAPCLTLRGTQVEPAVQLTPCHTLTEVCRRVHAALLLTP